jgi:hypothetical protein
VAIALVALIAFTGLVVDYGILWLARRQAQNSADAGAMAGAVSLGFVDFDNRNLARQAALDVALKNEVWLSVPDVTGADITFPPCPPGAPAAGSNACIRVDVFRNQRPNGNPLETIFGRLFNVMDQGVKATATAEVLWGTAASCVRPWAIPDKWKENQTPDWDQFDTFDRYDDSGVLIPGTVDPNGPGDYYEPAGPIEDSLLTPPSQTGTGFVNGDINDGGDYGRQFTLKQGDPHENLQPGWYFPIVICSTGGDAYREAIDGTCSCDVTITPPVTLDQEPGNMVGPTDQGVTALINQDQDAYWYDPDGDAGPIRGVVKGGCTDTATCPTSTGLSPRVVPIPVFDPDVYDSTDRNGRDTVNIVKIVGFFIEEITDPGRDVVGRLMDYPTEPSETPPPVGSSFLVSIALVR